MSLLHEDFITKKEILFLINTAQKMQDGLLKSNMDGEKAINIFSEFSTRTQISFAIAEDNLNIYNKTLIKRHSSIQKQESLYDTVMTLKALGFNCFIIRDSDSFFYKSLENINNISIINAGAGRDSHPSQALLDAKTIYDYYKKFQGITIAIIGDLYYSRVFKSDYRLFKKLGCHIVSYGPKEWNAHVDNPTYNNDFNINDLSSFDVLIFLRNQKERHSENVIEIANYNALYGLNPENIKTLKSTSIILHPGPINYGIEIHESLINNAKLKTYEQVKNGVYIRMAILYYCIKKDKNELYI